MRNTILRKNNGITLIALVVTIIVLIILAGISLNLVLGENGIIQRAKDASKLSSESTAMEKLTITLTDIYAEKQLNSELSENDIDAMLIKEGYVVNADIVIVDGYQFKIDKNIPKILINLGKKTENKDIKITMFQQLATDYTKSTIKIQIEYDGVLTNIQLAGENLELPEKVDNTYTIEKIVKNNNNYSVYVENDKEEYSMASIEVTQISENMQIIDATGLISLAQRVNNGETFEGKTITLNQDIDLSSVCGENVGSWVPIGNRTNKFQGTFNGNGKKIKNLYINSFYEDAGFFGDIGEYAQIESLVFENPYINSRRTTAGGATRTGAVAGINRGNIKKCKILKQENVTNSKIEAYVNINIQYGAPYIGSICGFNEGGIEQCFSNVPIIATSEGHSYRAIYCGGITGENFGNIVASANIGNIQTSSAKFIMCGGVCGDNFNNIKNSFSFANIETPSASYLYRCGIVARNWSGGQILNCYYKKVNNISYAWNNDNNTSSWTGGFFIEENAFNTQNTLNKLNAGLEKPVWIINGNYEFPVQEWMLLDAEK